MKLLLNRGADVNFKEKSHHHTALHKSVNIGNKEIIELLLNNGAHVNAKNNKGKTALILVWAMTFPRDKEEIIPLLLSKGADSKAPI